jgi:hypothetical protein
MFRETEKASEGDGWLCGSAPSCYGISLGSNPDISQKYTMGDISKGVANTLKPAKKINKKMLSDFVLIN